MGVSPFVASCAYNDVSLTGVEIVSWLELEHGTKPGMMQIRARGVALRENRDRKAREQNTGRYARSCEEGHLDWACRAKDPGEHQNGRGYGCAEDQQRLSVCMDV